MQEWSKVNDNIRKLPKAQVLLGWTCCKAYRPIQLLSGIQEIRKDLHDNEKMIQSNNLSQNGKEGCTQGRMEVHCNQQCITASNSLLIRVVYIYIEERLAVQSEYTQKLNCSNYTYTNMMKTKKYICTQQK